VSRRDVHARPQFSKASSTGSRTAAVGRGVGNGDGFCVMIA
jgi:hypothetical protein